MRKKALRSARLKICDKPKDFEKTVSSLSEVLKDKFTWR